MTLRQNLMKLIYPAILLFSKRSGKRGIVAENKTRVHPPVSIYNYKVEAITGDMLELSNYKGKKILLVNTASDCGYTAQYSSLQQLNESIKDLVIIGFPSNDFKEQEKGSDEEIVSFCQKNFSVTFPLAKKSKLLGGGDQNSVFKWLTDEKLNGWNSRLPVWNFTKFLIDEAGVLTHYFGPGIDPLDSAIIQSLQTNS